MKLPEATRLQLDLARRMTRHGDFIGARAAYADASQDREHLRSLVYFAVRLAFVDRPGCRVEVVDGPALGDDRFVIRVENEPNIGLSDVPTNVMGCVSRLPMFDVEYAHLHGQRMRKEWRSYERAAKCPFGAEDPAISEQYQRALFTTQMEEIGYYRALGPGERMPHEHAYEIIRQSADRAAARRKALIG